MFGYKAAVVIAICSSAGVALGILIANWNFVDPDVLRGARALFGLLGAVIGGFASKWMISHESAD